TPRDTKEKVSYGSARFSKDGKAIYVTTDQGSEFQRLALLDMSGKNPKFLTSGILWDVEFFDISHDGKRLAFVTNDGGLSVLHLMDTTTHKEMELPKLPAGVMQEVRWHRDGHDLAFSLTNAQGAGDCYSRDVTNGKLERWTVRKT